MKLLAFETATEACSVALYVDGQIIERHEIAPRLHAEYALPWAEELLSQAGIKRSQLDLIAISRGPGAFTGVRLAIALGQGIALALGKPMVGVSTLMAIAAALPPPSRRQGRDGEGLRDSPEGLPTQNQPPPNLPLHSQGEGPKERILAAIDARMGEVYVGAFERNGEGLIAVSTEVVSAPDKVVLPDDQGGWHAVGTGFSAAGNALQAHLASQLLSVDATVLPHAADVARLAVAAYARGEALAPERVEPAYLRNNVALTLEEQKAARALR
ncbi:MAG: tRNA (adenosine(37)-N6)-threonylcarbamoyltransferase complex dimerization subunit type 1 TsaB [Pseudoxanthomonas sp.]